MAAAAIVLAIICNLLENRFPHHQARSGQQRNTEEGVAPMAKRAWKYLGYAVTVMLGWIASGVAAAALG
jgi:hypothetical protein